MIKDLIRVGETGPKTGRKVLSVERGLEVAWIGDVWRHRAYLLHNFHIFQNTDLSQTF